MGLDLVDSRPASRLAWRVCLLVLLQSLLFLAGCASGPRLVDHAFGFDAVADSPGIEVLDYRYGAAGVPGSRMPEWVRKEGRGAGGTHTSGPMAVGDSLYVRWRMRATGEELQDTVDLRTRLQSDMSGHTIYFVVRERQLHVYLVTPQRRDAADAVIGPAKFRLHKVRLIYPP